MRIRATCILVVYSVYAPDSRERCAGFITIFQVGLIDIKGQSQIGNGEILDRIRELLRGNGSLEGQKQ